MLADGNSNYLYGLGRIGEKGTAGWQYHHEDALGSVRQLTDPGGAITLAKSYEPYGELLSSAGDVDTPYDFAGEWRDNTGLIYLRARYYQATVGRFISRDIWSGDYSRPLSLNRWSYVENNPITRIDPSGFVSTCAKGTCGPDVTEWFMDQMKYHYAYGLKISTLKSFMYAKASLLHSSIPSTLFWLATETPYREIVRELKLPSTDIPIGSYPVNSVTAFGAIEALGILEYAAYGLAVDYSNLNYPFNSACDQGCSEALYGNKNHKVVTLCDHCIDTSDMGNMMFGLGGAVRGYSLPLTYVSAAMYNVLNDWIPNRGSGWEGFKDAFLSPDGRGAIPGWLIGKSGAFLNKNLFCTLVNSTRIIGYNENIDQIGQCGTCTSKVGTILTERPSSLIRVSRIGGSEGAPVLTELQEKINSLFR